jgi:hypothetical protein
MALCCLLLLSVAPTAAPFAQATGAAVGFEARGVDPLAAVSNPLGLDVRDALGRPVSADKVMRDLSRGQARQAKESSYAEALPGAGRLSALGSLGAWLRSALGRPPGGSSPAVWCRALSSRPGDKLARLMILFFGALLWRRRESCRFATFAPAFRTCFVLRC